MNNEKTEYCVRFEDFGKKQYLKLLPIHRLAAAHVPFRGGSNGQGQELPVPIHRRAGQVDQNGKAVQTQHLLQ